MHIKQYSMNVNELPAKECISSTLPFTSNTIQLVYELPRFAETHSLGCVLRLCKNKLIIIVGSIYLVFFLMQLFFASEWKTQDSCLESKSQSLTFFSLTHSLTRLLSLYCCYWIYKFVYFHFVNDVDGTTCNFITTQYTSNI